MSWTRQQVAALVDHTLLKPEATAADVASLCWEAADLGVCAVCVSPSMLGAVEVPERVKIATVVGFPSGKHDSQIKAREAALSVVGSDGRRGADEVDMVIDVGAAIAGDISAVFADISAVRGAAPMAVLKVIVESAALLNMAGAPTLADVCRAAADAGADFVKTSTGFHPAGGASVQAVEIMAQTVPALGIKASGGIRSAADAVAMLDAGATRLGLSGTRAVLDGLN
ncbi:MAG: deoxyribose-phosphate aldolase [Mycobacterium sp.]|uniref:deoxyribose-phosphate aldolase n=1 Tax=Mycobacterium sp. SM3041 TaxID=3114291 RepID=UPI0011D575BA|nr:MAG: deoxyribose-phosphate aldolase [Mycobacterium sp.]